MLIVYLNEYFFFILDFESRDFCVVFFIDDCKYSVVKAKTVICEGEIERKKEVIVKEGTKKYPATVMYIGG